MPLIFLFLYHVGVLDGDLDGVPCFLKAAYQFIDSLGMVLKQPAILLNHQRCIRPVRAITYTPSRHHRDRRTSRLTTRAVQWA